MLQGLFIIGIPIKLLWDNSSPIAWLFSKIEVFYLRHTSKLSFVNDKGVIEGNKWKVTVYTVLI